jgi:hypothetical protein
MWLRPQPRDQKQSWYDWLGDWRLWLGQVKMNLWFGRGGLNVKVGVPWLSRSLCTVPIKTETG